MKKSGTMRGTISFIKGAAALAVMITVFCATTFISLAAKGTVTADTARIRKEADTDSEVVGSTVKGKTIDILDAVKDSSGTVWYKVSVTGGEYGYIRSDMVKTDETIQVSGSASTPTQAPAENESKPDPTVPTSIGEQAATVKSDTNVRIRSGASTKHDVVTALPNGTAITLIGEANDSAGNKWYQLTCNYNGKNVEGYIRSDLITIGGGESTENENPSEEGTPEEGTPEGEGTEGENPEGESTEGENQEAAGEESGSAPVEEQHRDYEIVYEQNSEGEYEYYLYNNLAGTKQTINNLLAVVNSAPATDKLQKQADNEKIVIIILAVVIVILFIILTVLLFKLRDAYYDYEEEEEEEEPEPEPVRKKVKKRVEEEEPAPVKRRKAPVQEDRERPVRTGKPQQKVREEKELHAAEAKEPVKRAPARKPQNFLIDDDEFEFEFLNMDDKDL